MRISDTTRKSFHAVAAAGVLSLGLAGSAALAAGSDGPGDETYEWSATLVDYDATNHTAVLQARVVTYPALDGLSDFSDGDRLTLVWSGRQWASGVRGLSPDPDLESWALTLPVEFVSTEQDDKYVNFRISVPEPAIDLVADTEPGTRLRGVSPKSAPDWNSGVTALRHYTDVD